MNPQDASGSARPNRVVPRRVAHGVVVGALAALAFVELLALSVLLYVEAPVGEATVAIGTLALAIATAGLAFATFALVRTTAVEMDLLRQQTAAMTDQARIAREQLDELREARFADFLPVLHWQLHPDRRGATYSGEDTDTLYIELEVLLTNVARAPARLTSLHVSVRDHPEEVFTPYGLVTPSTLPAGERIKLVLSHRRRGGDFPGERTIDLDLMYADMANLRRYQTRPSFTVRWLPKGTEIVSLDADDLSPSEREWDEKMQARWGDQGLG